VVNVQLNSRERRIALEILRSRGLIGLREIASSLGVTPRIVRYSLPQVERWLAKNNVSLIKEPYKGVRVDLSDLERQRLRRKLETISPNQVVLLPEERQDWIILRLLRSEEPIPIKSLAHNLGISYSTAVRDLKEAEKWLTARKLFIVRRPGLGLILSGQEMDRRDALVAFIVEKVGLERLQALSLGSMGPIRARQVVEEVGLYSALMDLLSEMDGSVGRKLVSDIEVVTGQRLPPDLRAVLELRLSIMHWRLQNEHEVNMPAPIVSDLKTRSVYRVAERVVAELSKKLQRSLPEDETAYIALHMAGTTLRLPKDKEEEAEQETFVEKTAARASITTLVDVVLSEAAVYLHPWLRADPELREALLKHLTKSLDMLHFGLPINNPLTERTWKELPYVYQVAKRCARIIERETGLYIPEDEIAFIAMHFGAALERMRPAGGAHKRVIVVCGAGAATAWMLVSRLRAELPYIEVVEVLSAEELSGRRVMAEGVDAVISTVPLESDMVPVFTVSPFLDKSDVAMLVSALNGRHKVEEAKVQGDRYGPTLLQLLSRQTVATGVWVNNWEESVDAAGYLLLSVGAIYHSYIEAMKGIIHRYGPYCVVAPGVALLHARPEDGVRRLALSLVTLASPVEFGHETNDPVSIVFSLATVDSRSHLAALAQLAALIQKQDFIKALGKVKSDAEAIDLIKRVSETIEVDDNMLLP